MFSRTSYRRLPIFTALAVSFLALTPRAQAAGDWLDDMPEVAVVAEEVRNYWYAGQKSNPALVGDKDFYAEQLVGAFIILRRIMEIEVARERTLSREREMRRRRIESAYLAAEHLIGMGIGSRKGSLTQLCEQSIARPPAPGRKAWFDSAGRQRYASMADCVEEMYPRDLSNIYNSYRYRNDILPRLFCDKAARYLALDFTPPEPQVRSPSFAVMRDMGQGVRPTNVCRPKHDDRDGNGLCDDWERKYHEFEVLEHCTCQQPQPTLTYERYKASKGLFGPYPNARAAVHATTPAAIRATRADRVAKEFGFNVVRDVRCESGCYYVTPLVIGSESSKTVSDADYTESLRRGLVGSCLASELVLVAEVHTHPPGELRQFIEDLGKYMSCSDFERAAAVKKEKERRFEGAFMIQSTTGCVGFFEPIVDQPACEGDLRVMAKLQGGLGSTPIYDSYLEKVDTVCPNPVTPAPP